MFNVAYILEFVVEGFYVTKCMSSMKSLSKSSYLMYPLSANISSNSHCVKSLSFKGSQSSKFPGVSVHCIISTRLFITICSLDPYNHPIVHLPLAAHPSIVLWLCARFILNDLNGGGVDNGYSRTLIQRACLQEHPKL